MVTSRGRRSTLEQERSRRSREALLDAATELLAETAIDEVRIEEICDSAGVSKGLFYFYFGSKEELVVELLADDAGAVAATIDEGIQHAEDVEAVLESALAVMARRAQRRPRHLLLTGVAEVLGRPASTDVASDDGALAAAFARLVQHGQALGAVDDDVDSREAGALLSVALQRTVLEWAGSERRQPSLARRLAARAQLVTGGLLR